MAASAPNRDEMYEHLLAISREAFREGSFEVAFHALCAAMHRAKDKKNVPYLRELLQEAEQHMQLIDTGYPNHPLPSSSAASRKHESIYRSLQRQISANIRMYEVQGSLQDHSKQQEGATSD
jgi:hypothetical protein